MSEVYEWDRTAANNDDTPPDGFPEDMDYDKVNDSAREVMAALKRQWEDHNGSRTSTTGTVATYDVTTRRTISALVDGLAVTFQAHADNNAGAATLSINGGAAKDLELPDGAAPDIVQGGVYEAWYESTNDRFVLVSATKPGAALNSVIDKGSDFTISSNDVGSILRITSDLTITIPAGGIGGEEGSYVLIDNTGGYSITLNNQVTTGSIDRLYATFVTGFAASGSTLGVGGTSQPFLTLRFLSATTGNHIVSDF